MKQLTQQEIKDESLNILKVVHEFCESNGITYYINYGTLLGAVRHNGFIPWDDDIDISMPRPDYERFIKEFSVEGYNCVNYLKQKKNVLTYAKVCSNKTCGVFKDLYKLDFGISIDIFPLDGLPKEDDAISSYYIKMRKLFNKYMRIDQFEEIKRIDSIKSFVKKFIALFTSTKSFAIKLHSTAVKYVYDESDKVACIVCLYSKKNHILNKSWFEERIMLPFEETSFYAPAGYKEVLSVIYGNDYMTPPPVESRGSLHAAEKYYWCE